MIPKQNDSGHAGHHVIIGQNVTVLVHDAPASHAEPSLGLAEYGGNAGSVFRTIRTVSVTLGEFSGGAPMDKAEANERAVASFRKGAWKAPLLQFLDSDIAKIQVVGSP